MRRTATVVVAAIAVTISAAAATAGRPVRVLGRIPTLPHRPDLAGHAACAAGARRGRASGRTVGEVPDDADRAPQVQGRDPARHTGPLEPVGAAGRQALPAGIDPRGRTRTYRLEVPAQLLANPDGSLLVAERGLRNRITRIDPARPRLALLHRAAKPYGLAWQGQRLQGLWIDEPEEMQAALDALRRRQAARLIRHTFAD
jgi:hypothetical protein